jgi:sortase A
MKWQVRQKLIRRGGFGLLHWASNLLMLAGCAALVWCGVVRFQAYRYQKWASSHLASVTQVEQQTKVKQHPTGRLTSAPAEGSLIGWIDIPRIGVNSAVLEGTDSSTLRLGVGHFEETALPGASGNVALAGHRDTFFRALRGIRPADEIILQTLDGCYKYAVESTTVVEPNDVDVLKSHAQPTLTLVTCYPFDFMGPAPKRFIVRANRTTG